MAEGIMSPVSPPATHPLVDEDEDDISLTSTLSEIIDSEEEFDALEILAERPHPEDDSSYQYLVSWLGYALPDCTWEPGVNIGPELMETWTTKKEEVKSGVVEPFDVAVFNDARQQIDDAKLHRKARRQAKRDRIKKRKEARTARPLVRSGQGIQKQSVNDFFDDIRSESSDEAVEDNSATHVAPPVATVAKKPPAPQAQKVQKEQQHSQKESQQPQAPPPRQTTFHLPNETPANKVTATKEVRRGTNKDNPLAKFGSSVNQTKKSNTSASTQSEPASATGYQGTARKPSNKTKDASTAGNATLSKSTIPPTKAAPKSQVKQAGKTTASKTTTSLTAKKTKAKPPSQPTPSVPVGNVFSGGKMRKKRDTLKQIAADESRDPKFFKNYRQIQQTLMYGREKGDDAPDFNQIADKLFDPSDIAQRRTSMNSTSSMPASPIGMAPSNNNMKRPGGILKSSTSTVISPTDSETNDGQNKRRKSAQFALSENGDGTITHDPMQIDSTEPAAVSSGPQQIVKKKKSVRFLADDETPVVQEPMELDTTDPVPLCSASNGNSKPGQLRLTTEQSSPIQAESQRPATAIKKINLSEYRQSKGLQVAQKQLLFGATTTTPMTVLFNGLPRDTSQPWASAFSQEQSIGLAHTCFAETFLAQWAGIRDAVVSQGTITAKSDEESTKLDRVAEHLMATGAGLYHSHQAFNVLIYPTKCDEWQSEQLEFETASPSDAALRYAIFTSTINCELFMVAPKNEGDSLCGPVDKLEQASLRDTLMSNAFGLDKQQYLRLLHPKEVYTKPHTFFLIFPLSRQDMLKQVGLWLRQQNPDCQIFTCHENGSWYEFYAAASQRAAAVVIHESALPSVRRIPKLYDLLFNTSTHWWLWSQPIEGPSIFPMIESMATDPCQVQLARLFPAGKTAIFITPSFLVSEPKHAYELFKWYYHCRSSKGSRWKLVTAWGLGTWLMELAVAKDRESQLLNDRYTVLDAHLKANIRGITRSECEFRFKTWTLVAQMLECRENEDPLSAYDDTSTFIYADESIDPNDEQSLVNWFGLWSEEHMDEFRHFHVIGSSLNIMKDKCERGRHTFKIPKYTKTSKSDPGSARDAVQTTSLAPPKSEQQAHLMSPEERLSRLRLLRGADSEYTRGDIADTHHLLRNDLMKLPYTPYHRSYGFPIFWKQRSDGWVSDFKGFHKTTAEWFAFPFPFAEDKNFTTYPGLFYTPREEPGQQHGEVGLLGIRHAWVLIYRVLNFHTKPWKHTEVLIWDPAAPLLFAGQAEVREEDLSKDQKFVLQYIRDNESDKNPQYPLKRVWYGGSQRTPNSGSQTLQRDVDIAMAFLFDAMNEPHKHFPVFDSEIRAQGYVPLVNASKQDQDIPAQVDKDIKHNAPEAESTQDGGDEKIVFHPPRAGPNLGSSSKCGNALHEYVRLARVRDPEKQLIEYEYKPTGVWYADQRHEGRGFEHINVETWENIFNLFKISQGGNVADSAGSTS